MAALRQKAEVHLIKWFTSANGQEQTLEVIRPYEQLSKKKATPEEVALTLGIV